MTVINSILLADLKANCAALISHPPLHLIRPVRACSTGRAPSPELSVCLVVLAELERAKTELASDRALRNKNQLLAHQVVSTSEWLASVNNLHICQHVIFKIPPQHVTRSLDRCVCLLSRWIMQMELILFRAGAKPSYTFICLAIVRDAWDSYYRQEAIRTLISGVDRLSFESLDAVFASMHPLRMFTIDPLHVPVHLNYSTIAKLIYKSLYRLIILHLNHLPHLGLYYVAFYP